MKVTAIIYGIGKKYDESINIIKLYEKAGMLDIVGVSAKELVYGQIIDGYLTISPVDIKKYQFDCIIVCVENMESVIKDLVECHEIERNKLWKYSIMNVPGFSPIKYKQLRQNTPTIISNNCWAGILYNTLNLECCSPTKNLFIKDKDYIRFINDFEKYKLEKIRFLRFDERRLDKVKYPVLELAGLEIHCNHSENVDKAIQDWERRCAKIKSNNIIFEMYTTDKEIANKFENVNKGKNHFCFVPWEELNENQIKLEMEAEQTEFWQTVIASAQNGKNSKEYDKFKLITGEGVVKRLVKCQGERR